MTCPLPPKYTYFNGAKDSAVFLKSGEAIYADIASPLTVIGGGKQFQVAQGAVSTFVTHNNQTTTIQAFEMHTSSLGYRFTASPGPGKGAGISIRNKNAIGSLAADITVGTNGDLSLNSGSATTRIEDATVICGTALASDPQLQVRGDLGSGLVYDTLYRPPTSIYSQSTVTTGTILANDTYTFNLKMEPGIYALQTQVNLAEDATISFGKALEIWLQRPTGVSPNEYRQGSEIHIMSTMINPPALGTSSQPNFMSGLFQTSGSEDWSVYVTADGTWDFGTGTVAIQPIKYGILS